MWSLEWLFCVILVFAPVHSGVLHNHPNPTSHNHPVYHTYHEVHHHDHQQPKVTYSVVPSEHTYVQHYKNPYETQHNQNYQYNSQYAYNYQAPVYQSAQNQYTYHNNHQQQIYNNAQLNYQQPIINNDNHNYQQPIVNNDNHNYQQPNINNDNHNYQPPIINNDNHNYQQPIYNNDQQHQHEHYSINNHHEHSSHHTDDHEDHITSFEYQDEDHTSDYNDHSHEHHQTHHYQTSHNIAPVTKKFIYFHVPPPNFERPQYQVPVAPPKKTYKIIFIKAPAPATKQHISLPNPTEEKTLIYVLVKKPQEPNLHIPIPTVNESKPEVFYVKYKQNQIEDIASQVNQGLSVNNISNEGTLLPGLVNGQLVTHKK